MAPLTDQVILLAIKGVTMIENEMWDSESMQTEVELLRRGERILEAIYRIVSSHTTHLSFEVDEKGNRPIQTFTDWSKTKTEGIRVSQAFLTRFERNERSFRRVQALVQGQSIEIQISDWHKKTKKCG